jgi:stage V sporulation protein D (sporulation-specific penicillin-binding protein)
MAAGKKEKTNSVIRTQKRMILTFVMIAALFAALTFRIGWVAVVASDTYAKMAAERQTRDEIIPAKRGTIYDRNMKEMALSAVSYRIFVRPSEVPAGKNDAEKAARLEKTAALLSEKLSISLEEVKEMVTQDKTRVRVAKDVSRETAEEIRAIIYEEGLGGVEIEDDVKRYYPLGAFAAHALGGVNDENYGLGGVELQYNSYLSGVMGRWVKNADRMGDSLSYGVESYHGEQDGVNLVLTIDEVIQLYVERAIEKVRESSGAQRVMGLVMDPKTGDILAMGMTPDYDPNEPRVPLDPAEAARVAGLTPEEQLNYWNSMWRNPMISDVYDPGSTFKLFTVSAALEEGVVRPEDYFNCSGYYNVGGTTLRCWRYYNPHGDETLVEAVGNSCNPVMIQLSQRMGWDKFYQYLEKFGFTEKTGIDYPSEGRALLQDKEAAGPVGLATMSFGQGLSITPIQLITAVSAIGNEGKLMQPRLVKALTDQNGNIVESFDTKVTRQVISEKTADEMKKIMEFVVDESGGKVAGIPGYRIGGKTGTAEKLFNGSYKSGKVTASMVAMAPMDDPQISVLIVVDEPQGIKFGSTTAGPGVRDILSEVLRYLNIRPAQLTDAERAAVEAKQVSVPDLRGMNYSDAAGLLLGKRLRYTDSPAIGESEDFMVADQYPKPGERLDPGGLVYLYRE